MRQNSGEENPGIIYTSVAAKKTKYFRIFLLLRKGQVSQDYFTSCLL